MEVCTSALLFMMTLVEADILKKEKKLGKCAAEFMGICVALADFAGYP